jgi:hypothetical protein
MRFQLNRLDKESIDKALSNNSKGVFNLNPGITDRIADIMNKYLKGNWENYVFELNFAKTNYEIMFQKKGVKN